jgi:CDP-glucose 4,6-dehydratase
MRKQRPVIRSDGRTTRDFLYVEESAAAHMFLAEQLAQREELAGEAFNLSSESRHTVRQIVQSILDVAGSTLQPDILGELMAESTQNLLSIGKAQRVLGWAPAIPFEEGLRRTFEWYRDYLAEPTHDKDILPITRAA